jgi:hypothetical protein
MSTIQVQRGSMRNIATDIPNWAAVCACMPLLRKILSSDGKIEIGYLVGKLQIFAPNGKHLSLLLG